uniref:Uncharacterized protein n=1 Tax=Ditylenchus dipsaci TaxID=166011 RepID=A0A915DJ18_9BILA
MVRGNFIFPDTQAVSPLTNSKFELHDDSMGSVEQLGTEVQNILQASGVDPRKFSILSPKILSIFGSESGDRHKRPGLLSPELLSFTHNSGLLSLPQVLG